MFNFRVREVIIRTWLSRNGRQGEKLHQRLSAELWNSFICNWMNYLRCALGSVGKREKQRAIHVDVDCQ
jgi:hypothetical protein